MPCWWTGQKIKPRCKKNPQKRKKRKENHKYMLRVLKLYYISVFLASGELFLRKKWSIFFKWTTSNLIDCSPVCYEYIPNWTTGRKVKVSLHWLHAVSQSVSQSVAHSRWRHLHSPRSWRPVRRSVPLCSSRPVLVLVLGRRRIRIRSGACYLRCKSAGSSMTFLP